MVSLYTHFLWQRVLPVVLSAGLAVAPSYAFAADPSAGPQTGSGATEVTVVGSGSVVNSGTDEPSTDKPGSSSNPAAGNVTRTASVGGTSGGGGASGGSSGGGGKLSKTGDYAVSSSLLALAALTGIALVGSGAGLRRRGEACDA